MNWNPASQIPPLLISLLQICSPGQKLSWWGSRLLWSVLRINSWGVKDAGEAAGEAEGETELWCSRNKGSSWPQVELWSWGGSADVSTSRQEYWAPRRGMASGEAVPRGQPCALRGQRSAAGEICASILKGSRQHNTGFIVASLPPKTLPAVHFTLFKNGPPLFTKDVGFRNSAQSTPKLCF